MSKEITEALKTLEVLDKIISPLLEPVLAEYEDDLSDKITANYFALKQALIKSQEELGNNLSGKNEDCSFKVLFEATKYGFWYKVKYLNKYIHLVPDENHTIVYSWNDGYPILQYMEVTNDICYTLQCVYDVFITDYKKTFWLKEDRSE